MPKVHEALGCTPFDYEKILEYANTLMKRNMSGPRGQTMTVYDSFDYWVIVATREYYRNA